MKNNNSGNKNTSLFSLDGNPSLKTALPLSLQHYIAMIVGNVLPALVLSGAMNLTSEQSLLLVQSSMFIAAIATFLQSTPLFGFGAGVPMINGISFAYIPTLMAVGVEYGLGAILGSQLIGGMIAILVGFSLKKIRKYFPPMVSGTVVFTVGLSLYKTAVNYMAGGFAATDPRYGGLVYWGIAFLTLAVVLICNMFGKGIFKLSGVLIGVLVGYAASYAAGLVSFDAIGDAAWLALPKIMPYQLEFQGAAVASIAIMFIVNSIQDIGQVSGITVGGLDRDATDEEVSGAIKANGLSSMIGAVIGALPTASYGQNVGIVATTKVVSLKVTRITAIVIFLTGLVPKFSALITSIPQCVIGGATISVFAQITMSGIKLIIKDELSVRNTTIVGLGVALGMGITQIDPAGLQYFPSWVKMVFGTSPVALATIVVFILNILIPNKTIEQEQAEREEADKK